MQEIEDAVGENHGSASRLNLLCKPSGGIDRMAIV